jgi:hypothetical protein
VLDAQAVMLSERAKEGRIPSFLTIAARIGKASNLQNIRRLCRAGVSKSESQSGTGSWKGNADRAVALRPGNVESRV